VFISILSGLDLRERLGLVQPGEVCVLVITCRDLCNRCNYLWYSGTSWTVCSRENWT